MDMYKIENGNELKDNKEKEFESLEREIERSKKILDRQTGILNDAIEEMTKDKENGT